MIMQSPAPVAQKEVIALDADDHLARPILMLSSTSGVCLIRVHLNRFHMRGAGSLVTP
jgi:hypothetical protein